MTGKFKPIKASHIKTVLYIVGLITVLVFVTYHIVGMLRSDVISVRASEEITEESIRLTAFLARDEKVIAGETGGVLVSEISNGTKLKEGTLSVGLYPEAAIQTASRIEKEKKKLALLAGAMQYATEEKIDSNIAVSYSELMKSLAFGDSALKNEIVSLLSALSSREYFFDREPLRAAYAATEARIDELYSSLPSAIGTYKMPNSGYFFSDGDELGHLFGEELARLGTADDILSAMATYNNSEGKIRRAAVAASSSEWYLLCSANKSEVSGFVKGYTYSLFADGFKLSASLADIRESSDGKSCVLVLLMSELPEGFSYRRSMTVELSLGNERTYRIPASAIRTDENGIQGVYIVSGGVVLFRRVEILRSGEGYVLVRSEKNYKDSLGSIKAAEALYNNGEIPPLSAGIYRGSSDISPNEPDEDDTTLLIKLLFGDVKINTLSDESGSPYKYLEENEQIIISGNKLYHGKILG